MSYFGFYFAFLIRSHKAELVPKKPAADLVFIQRGFRQHLSGFSDSPRKSYGKIFSLEHSCMLIQRSLCCQGRLTCTSSAASMGMIQVRCDGPAARSDTPHCDNRA